jgi:hypothetical protein
MFQYADPDRREIMSPVRNLNHQRERPGAGVVWRVLMIYGDAHSFSIDQDGLSTSGLFYLHRAIQESYTSRFNMLQTSKFGNLKV